MTVFQSSTIAGSPLFAATAGSSMNAIWAMRDEGERSGSLSG
jgi:hypothetical protein